MSESHAQALKVQQLEISPMQTHIGRVRESHLLYFRILVVQQAVGTQADKSRHNAMGSPFKPHRAIAYNNIQGMKRILDTSTTCKIVTVSSRVKYFNSFGCAGESESGT
jgi:hypothetical protein